MKRKKCLVMVYGSLKKEYSNHGVIKHPTTKFLGEITTPERYTLYSGSFPIVERGGKTSIKGELYELNDEETIEDMFALEGCSSQTKGHPNNWYDIDDNIATPYGEAIIFVMDKGKSGRKNVIESGAWG